MNLELTPATLLSKLYSSLSLSLDQQLQTPHASIAPVKKVLMAFSGGLDSHVLLHLLAGISRTQLSVRAVYINHGLQLQAADWAQHCQQVCLKLNVPFSRVDLNLDRSKGESLEELARRARYKALYADLREDEILMTAHHQNDQAETVLLQLFRGAGVQGLAAMPNVSEIKVNAESYIHLRPLLNQSRQALEAYADEYGLKHIEDPSNQDTSFDRNFLRQKIMPLLRQRWLGIDKAISRTASLQAETKTLLDEVSQQELPTVLAAETACFTYGNQNSLRLPPIVISELLKYSENKQRLLLRYWISQQGFPTPSAKKLQHIFADVILSAKDRQPLVEWKGTEIRCFQQYLYISAPLPKHDVTQVISWQLAQPLHIPSINTTLEPSLIKVHNNTVTVRFRQGGESIEIPKRGNLRVKNLFQEKQVPPWIRPRLPLIYIADKLVKIVGLEDFKRHPPTF